MNGLLRVFATGPDRPLIPDQQRIDTLFRSYRMRVMLAITVGYAFAYTCRLALSVVKKPLIDEGIFSPSELGLIGSALLYTYAFAKLVNGFLADHANIRVFFAFGVLVSALIVTPAAAAYQLTEDFRRMMALAVVIGVGSAMGGLLLSYPLNTASGATIVLLATAAFFVAALLSPRRRRAAKGSARTQEAA